MTVSHPMDILKEELSARGWAVADLVERMAGERAVNELALDMYDELRERFVPLGPTVWKEIADVLGTSVEVWWGVEQEWLMSETVQPGEPADLSLETLDRAMRELNESGLNRPYYQCPICKEFLCELGDVDSLDPIVHEGITVYFCDKHTKVVREAIAKRAVDAAEKKARKEKECDT